MDDVLDERIGPYHLTARLGEGGMGVVYRATDGAGRDVALKLIRPEFAQDGAFRRRLAREVDTMRRVRSPHVAEVLDADVAADRPFIVTRFIDGLPLDDAVRAGGPLSGGPLGRLAAGLADALVAIHDAGVIHRDLKPNNVMLVEGAPVVIDFGIAHAVDSTRLTRTGMIVGTPGYMGPEIIDGLPPDTPVDVFGWAATVVFAATGRSPFGSGSFESVLARIVSGRPDLDGVPRRLDPCLRAALERDPARRPSAARLSVVVREADLGAPEPPEVTALEPPGTAGPDAGTSEAPAVARSPRAPARRVPLGYYKLLAYLAIVIAIAVCAVFPPLGAAGALAAVWYLRAGDSAVRSRRVPILGGADLALAPVRAPGSLARSAVLLVPAAVYPGAVAGVLAAGLLTLSAFGDQVSPAGAARWAAVAFGYMTLAGPGIMAPRRQVVRLISLAQTRRSAAVVTVVLLGGVALAAAVVGTRHPHWWPAPDPRGPLAHIVRRLAGLLGRG